MNSNIFTSITSNVAASATASTVASTTASAVTSKYMSTASKIAAGAGIAGLAILGGIAIVKLVKNAKENNAANLAEQQEVMRIKAEAEVLAEQFAADMGKIAAETEQLIESTEEMIDEVAEIRETIRENENEQNESEVEATAEEATEMSGEGAYDAYLDKLFDNAMSTLNDAAAAIEKEEAAAKSNSYLQSGTEENVIARAKACATITDDELVIKGVEELEGASVQDKVRHHLYNMLAVAKIAMRNGGMSDAMRTVYMREMKALFPLVSVKAERIRVRAEYILEYIPSWIVDLEDVIDELDFYDVPTDDDDIKVEGALTKVEYIDIVMATSHEWKARMEKLEKEIGEYMKELCKNP